MPRYDRFWVDDGQRRASVAPRGGTDRSTTGGLRRSISGVFLRIAEACRFGGAEPGSRARGQNANGRSKTELRGVSCSFSGNNAYIEVKRLFAGCPLYRSTSKLNGIFCGTSELSDLLCGYNSIAPFRLRSIKGIIGCFQQLRGTISVVGEHGDTNGERYGS
jgi:hypothetical protein